MPRSDPKPRSRKAAVAAAAAAVPPPAPASVPPSVLEPKGACGRREEILEAASRLFAEHGYSEADTQGLADDLGVGKGTLYRHFPSKRELFLAAADRAMERLYARIECSVAGADDPLVAIERALGAYLAFFAEHPHYVELLLQERAQFHDRAKPTYLEHRERHVERWRGLYRTLIAQGRVRDLGAERISDVVAAVLYGAMFLNHAGGRAGGRVVSAQDILEVLFGGILTASAQPDRPGS